MRTKISFALGKRQALSRQTAWGCFTTNLTAPGFGSLAAGRAVGYPQAALSIAGLILTVVPGIPFINWYLKNYSRLQAIQDDAGAYFGEIWLHLRWPLLGFGCFAAAILWALTTSLSILAEARRLREPAPGKKIPPILNPPKPSERLPPKLH